MTSDPSKNAYIVDLLGQPNALKETLAAFERPGFRGFEPIAAKLRSGKLRRAVLTGMGSSYHALHPLFLGMVRRGLPAQMIETSELIHHAAGLISADTLTVIVSQSGRSAEVLRLLERIPPGAPVVGVTNTADSPLAGQAGAVLLTRAGAESTVSCKTYLATMAALALLENLLAGEDPRPMLADLQSLPDAVGRYFARMEDYLAEMKGMLEGVRAVFLAGRGPSQAAAGTGGLIIKEAAHFPAEGMSSASFRHGPLELVSPEIFVLVYAGPPATAVLSKELAADIRKAKGRSALVKESAEEEAFHLPPAPAAGLPILEILPAQILSVALAELHGHTPGVFSVASKVTGTE